MNEQERAELERAEQEWLDEEDRIHDSELSSAFARITSVQEPEDETGRHGVTSIQKLKPGTDGYGVTGPRSEAKL